MASFAGVDFVLLRAIIVLTVRILDRVDSLEQRQKTFFSNCKKLKVADRDEEYQKIRKEYDKVIEDSSEKIQNAEECYNLVDRYLRKLDQELHKFKMELEADNRGITEILEQRSLETDNPTMSNAKDSRQSKKHHVWRLPLLLHSCRSRERNFLFAEFQSRKNHTIAHSGASMSGSISLGLGQEPPRTSGLPKKSGSSNPLLGDLR